MSCHCRCSGSNSTSYYNHVASIPSNSCDRPLDYPFYHAQVYDRSGYAQRFTQLINGKKADKKSVRMARCHIRKAQELLV